MVKHHRGFLSWLAILAVVPGLAAGTPRGDPAGERLGNTERKKIQDCDSWNCAGLRLPFANPVFGFDRPQARMMLFRSIARLPSSRTAMAGEQPSVCAQRMRCVLPAVAERVQAACVVSVVAPKAGRARGTVAAIRVAVAGFFLAGLPRKASAAPGGAPPSPAVVAERPAVKTFSIRADDATRSLEAFSEQARTQVIFFVEQVRGVRTNSVEGRYTAREALDRMAANTGLTVAQDRRSGAFIVKREAGAPLPLPPPDKTTPETKQTMQQSRSRRTPIALLTGLFTLLFAEPSMAQAADGDAAGIISGRIFNPATGEYVRNAEVRVLGSNAAAVSGDGGHYEIRNVPAGTARIEVRYAGSEPTAAVVNVLPGQTALQDFNLASAFQRDQSGEVTIRMKEFIVSTEREGNAKAIMDERNSMTLGTSVAADAFGDTTEGNIGEFLKYLPGLEVEYVGSTARNVRIGGLDPEYTGVAIDGNSLASADAAQQYNTTENTVAVGQGVRSFGFEQTSINSIESVEVLRVPGADKSADSPAGVVNLKTKRAFDRKGRRIAWSLGGSLHSEEFHLKKTVGPHDGHSYKTHPNFSLDYSDVFMNNRLGFLVGVSGSRFYTAQKLNLQRIQRTPSTADPRPQVVTAIVLSNTPKTTERFTTSLTADFKATPQLTLSLTASYNAYDARTYPRELTFQAATNNTNGTTGRRFVGGDGLTTISTGAATANARSVGLGAVGNAIKLTNSVSIVPKFEFRTRRIVVDGTLAYSRSKNTFAAIDRGTFKTAEVFPLQNVGFTATRPDALSPAWTIQQTSGLDWSDLANYRSNVVSGEHRFGFNEVYDGALNFRYNLPLRNPTFIKLGAKVLEKNSRYQGRGILEKWGYIGPGSGSYADFPSPVVLDFDAFGARITSANGDGVPTFPSRDALGALFHSNPEYFERRLVTAQNHYSANYVRNTKFKETIPAGYIQANTRVGRWQFQGGLRWEKTSTRSREPDPLRASEVRAAGYPVNASTQRASTIEGIDYQFGSRPRIERKGEYDNWFPSATAKFRLSERFNVDFGYSRAISRPPINQLSGIWTYTEDPDDPSAGIIRVPNPNLKPENSTKLVGGISYFFGSVGSLSLNFTQNDIKNLRISEDFTAEEFGITDPAFENYTVVSTRSGAGSRRFRSMDIHYRQQLTFLPKVLRGTGVFAGYTRTYSDLRRNGISPHKITAGVSYGYGKISGRVNGVWLDDAPWTNTVGRYRRQNLKIDVNASYRLGDKISIFANGRNVFNAPHEVIDGPPLGTPILFRYEDFGVAWNFGVKGEF